MASKFIILFFALLLVTGVSLKTTGEPGRTTSRPEPSLQAPLVISGLGKDVAATLLRILDRLSALETLNVDNGRKLDTLEFKITKMEILDQERSHEIDRLETRISRKVDDINNHAKQILTLMEVQRENVGTMMANMVELRILMADQGVDRPDKSTLIMDTAEGSNSRLQVVQTTLLNIRRSVTRTMTDMEKSLKTLSSLFNISQIIQNNTLNLVTTQYLYKHLKELQFPQTTGNNLYSNQILPYPYFMKTETDDDDLPRDCSELLTSPNSSEVKSGIYRIKPKRSPVPFFVYCDMETEGGGWTVFQRRTDGSTDFYRQWLDYKKGFGTLTKEFWLGNDKLYLLTIQKVNEMRIELQDYDAPNIKFYAKYSAFAIGPESEKYYLNILGDYTGDAGDAMAYHAGHAFTTKDIDNDQWPDGNCAETHYGAWWYNRCDTSNLNGLYLSGQTEQSYEGMYWYELHGPNYSLKSTEMKIRPVPY